MNESVPQLVRRRCSAARGQSGFVLLAGLTVWLLVGGVMMAVLLDMTLAATRRAAHDTERAQQLRAIDSALETAVLVIQTDDTDTVAVPDKNGDCAIGTGGATDLDYDDGLGATVRVTARCEPGPSSDAPMTVRLSARVVQPATSALLVGSARLDVTRVKGAGASVTVTDWSLVTPPDLRDVDLAAVAD